MFVISSLLKIPVLKPILCTIYLAFASTLSVQSETHLYFEVARNKDQNRDLT